MRARHATSPELRNALERLFSLQTFGIKLGLEPVSRLLAEIGDPHRAFPSIHVAGTNGKGSVCAMLASILRAHGLRVGLYTSPHLVDFAERIRVDGVPIDEERLATFAREMMPAIERIGCTFFEGTTAMGLRYFAEERVDIAVVETGMGGRLDATNVLAPLVGAITSIGLDHTKHLGDTLEAIAAEKAGIIKHDTPAVVGHVSPRVRGVIASHAESVGAPVAFVDEIVHAIHRSIDLTHTVGSFIVGRDARELSDVAIGLVGRHQIENARVALAAVEALRPRDRESRAITFDIDDATVRAGLRDIRVNTGLRGRFEVLGNDPPVIVDVAHNADGARVLADTLSLTTAARSARLVYGSVEDKDVGEVLRILSPVTSHLHAVRADNVRSLAAEEVLANARETGIDASLAGDVGSGVRDALAACRDDEVVVVCGSFFVVGEALVELDGPDGASPVDLAMTRDGTLRSRVAESTGTAYAVDRLDRDVSTRRLTVKEWNESEQPRERLMMLGASALSDAELLAILLRTGTRDVDVLAMSRRLLEHFNGDPAGEGALHRLAQRDYKELQAISGIGPTKAITLAAAFELGRRATAVSFAKRPRIGGPRDVAAMFIPELRHVQKEQFHVVILNTANQVVRRVLVSEGNLNSSIVHPREVYRHAIVENAAAIIGLHNHPSGNPTPSREDIAITKQLVDAGRIIGIALHDHIIIAGEDYVSLAEKGYV